MRIGFCIALLLFMPNLTGCSGGSIAPTRLAVTTNVYVESMPSEADVYRIDEHGNVDKHIGKTPLTIPVNTVPSQDFDGNCTGPFRAWSPAGFWSESGKDTVNSYKVSLLVIKEGYSDSYVSTILKYRCGAEKPDDTNMKVRLDEVKRDDQRIRQISY